MNKQELVASIAEKSGLTKAQSEKALNGMVGAITEQLGKGESVSLIGFGTFDVSNRSARQGKNPRTGEAVQIAARKVPRFAPGKTLKTVVNE
ncbi:MAG: HU family DNA-binding protein [Ignavibacteria bacterium]|nr:HU family DNA-binding protein [Ignavibacteria bacterium]